jgi:hypothetical protein
MRAGKRATRKGDADNAPIISPATEPKAIASRLITMFCPNPEASAGDHSSNATKAGLTGAPNAIQSTTITANRSLPG